MLFELSGMLTQKRDALAPGSFRSSNPFACRDSRRRGGWFYLAVAKKEADGGEAEGSPSPGVVKPRKKLGGARQRP